MKPSDALRSHPEDFRLLRKYLDNLLQAILGIPRYFENLKEIAIQEDNKHREAEIPCA